MMRAHRHDRRGTLLIDVMVALLVFAVALGTFLQLANSKTRMLEDNARRVLAFEIMERQLTDLMQVPLESLTEKHGTHFEAPTLPGAAAKCGTVQVVQGPIPGSYRVDVELEYRATDHHIRRVCLSQFRAEQGIPPEAPR